jgi:hypothetical protein
MRKANNNRIFCPDIGHRGRSLRRHDGSRQGQRVKVAIIEMLGLTACVGLTAAAWRAGQDRGIVAAIVLTTIVVYYANRLRSRTPFLATTLIALPMIAIFVFVIAVLTGLRHPPFMVPLGWQWPPFESIKERIVHAFALAIWTFILGTPTMLVLGSIRRLFAALNPTPETATNNPMDTKRRIDRF